MSNQSTNVDLGADTSDYETGNYPSAHDSTSSGGYGSAHNVFSPTAQRGRADLGLSSDNPHTLSEVNDLHTKQGADTSAQRNFQHESRQDFLHGNQNEIGAHSAGDIGDDAKRALGTGTGWQGFETQDMNQNEIGAHAAGGIGSGEKRALGTGTGWQGLDLHDAN